MQIENRAGSKRPPKRGGNSDIWLALGGLKTILKSEIENRDRLIAELREQVADQAAQLSAFKQGLENTDGTLRGLTEQVAELPTMVSNSLAPVNESLEQERAAATQAAQALDRRVNALAGTVEETRDEAQQSVAAVAASCGDLAARIELLPTAETVETAARAAAGEALQGIEAVNARLQDVTNQVEATGETLAALADVQAETERQVAAGNDRFEALGDRVDEVNARTGHVHEHLEQLAVRVGTVHERVDQVASDTQVAMERGTITADRLAELQDSHADQFEQLQGQIDGLEQQAPSRDARITALVDGVSERVATLTERVDEVAVRAGAVDEVQNSVRIQIGEMDMRVTEAVAEVRNESRQLVSRLPRSLLVDSHGNLVAITGEGDTVEIGRVSGRDGTDGATIQTASLVDNGLQITMTDGRTMYAGRLTLETKPTVDNNADLTERVKALRAQGKSKSAVVKELKTSFRRITKLVGGTDW